VCESTSDDGALAEYDMEKRVVKLAVDQAQQQERMKFGENLNMEEGQRYVFGMVKQLPKERQDVVRVNLF